MGESLFTRLVCGHCGSDFGSEPVSRFCPRCGKGTVEALYDYKALDLEALDSEPSSVWRYAPLLPGSRPRVSLQEGGTPLVRCTRVLGSRELLVKDESRNPTSSFADRGSTVATTFAASRGARRIACATDGDTGASVSAYASKAGLDCTVFAPTGAEAGKLIQTLVYGARLVRVRGSFRNSMKRCESACQSPGCSDLTIEASPFAFEGEKTTGFEIAEALGWHSPGYLVVPVGSGTNLSAIWKAFKELNMAGILEELPRMVGVQAAGCAPVVTAFEEGGDIREIRTSNHFASSIAVGDPVNGQAALRALRESRGLAFAVAEEEMDEAVNLLGGREGIFAEPASSATICAARRLIEDSIAESSDVIVCVVTGSGLKVPDAISRSLRPRLAGTWDLVRMEERSMGPIGKTKGQILEILEPGSNYGYSVRRQLQVRYGEEISLQAVYQHLDHLVEMGLVEVAQRAEASGKRNRKYFALSRRGKRVLRSLDTIKASLLEGGRRGDEGQILPSR